MRYNNNKKVVGFLMLEARKGWNKKSKVQCILYEIQRRKKIKKQILKKDIWYFIGSTDAAVIIAIQFDIFKAKIIKKLIFYKKIFDFNQTRARGCCFFKWFGGYKTH